MSDVYTGQKRKRETSDKHASNGKRNCNATDEDAAMVEPYKPTTDDIFEAARKGNVNDIRYFVANGADVNTHECKFNVWTPVHGAAFYGHAKCIDALAKLGAEVDTPDSRGNTPLILAAVRGHADCIKVLVVLGADVNNHNKDGQTPVLKAAYNDRADCIDVLVALGANVNTPDKEDRTPVYWAAFTGHAKCIEVLAANGADVNIPNITECTPVWIAAENGHVKCIKELAKIGADVNTPNKYGYTPMYIAWYPNCATALKNAGQLQERRALIRHTMGQTYRHISPYI